MRFRCANYLLTGPQTNRIGFYTFSILLAAEDLGTDRESIIKYMAQVCVTFDWHSDFNARVMWIPSWFKWNPPANTKVLKGVLRDLTEIPTCGLVAAFARHVTNALPDDLSDTVREWLRSHMPYLTDAISETALIPHRSSTDALSISTEAARKQHRYLTELRIRNRNRIRNRSGIRIMSKRSVSR
jgi:hypothetical protein